MGSVSDLLGELDIGNPQWQDDTWIFRGQNQDWDLLPPAMRDDSFVAQDMKKRFPSIYDGLKASDGFSEHLSLMYKDYMQRKLPPVNCTLGEIVSISQDVFLKRLVTMNLQLGYVKRLVGAFEELADRAHLELPMERLPTIWDSPQPFHEQYLVLFEQPFIRGGAEPLRVVYALAQHHRIPTMLLDWTYNPMVAAFFAAHDEGSESSESCADENSESQSSQEDMVIWAVRQKDLFRFGLRTVKHRRSQIGFLQAQDGLFVYDNYAEDWYLARGSWCPFDCHFKVMTGRGSVKKYALPFDEREHLLEELEKRNVSKPFLMPSFDNVAQAVKSRPMELIGKYNELPWLF